MKEPKLLGTMEPKVGFELMSLTLRGQSDIYYGTVLPRYMRGIISICTLQTGDFFLASGSEPTINVSVVLI